MTTVIPVVVAFGLGVLLARRIWRFVPPPQDETVALPGPLPPEEYQRRRQRNNDGYLDSMSKYDKLVPWASGGALVLSATFLSTLVGGASESTKWFLAGSWGSLLVSLLSSLGSQYASTRIYSWRNRYLEVLQKPLEPSAKPNVKEDWEKQARYYDWLASRNGRRTRRLNECAGLSLVLGLLLLVTFAFLNAPFGDR